MELKQILKKSDQCYPIIFKEKISNIIKVVATHLIICKPQPIIGDVGLRNKLKGARLGVQINNFIFCLESFTQFGLEKFPSNKDKFFASLYINKKEIKTELYILKTYHTKDALEAEKQYKEFIFNEIFPIFNIKPVF